MPWIQKNAPAKVDSKKTVLLGSSLGGLSSAYLALENPNQISHVVPLSGSFWWQNAPTDLPNGMSKIIRDKTSQPKQHWFITANSYESSRNNNELSILETSPIVAADLKSKGHDVHYQSYIGGHSYAVWQVALQDALKHFFVHK
ncbi:esterase family protein [Acinetobacter sp. YH12063]|uniref:alpha/beta hydrolase n=1 Tax=Acinetobacter sp. YH12063 TaxID=2601061 RepID=UPI00211E0A17|nr:alpha/beta fold hydrolase [Acinetobacter sp. YH12063]